MRRRAGVRVLPPTSPSGDRAREHRLERRRLRRRVKVDTSSIDPPSHWRVLLGESRSYRPFSRKVPCLPPYFLFRIRGFSGSDPTWSVANDGKVHMPDSRWKYELFGPSSPFRSKYFPAAPYFLYMINIGFRLKEVKHERPRLVSCQSWVICFVSSL